MKKTLLIYPHDNSSSFLLKPFHHLQHEYSLTCYEVFPNDSSHQICLCLLEKFETIIFMGHGSHKHLCGAKTNEYFLESFITADVINRATAKNILLFSCNSCDLIKSFSSKNAIGFGNLPTSYDEIMAAKEFDVNSYKGVTENSILAFQNAINWLVIQLAHALLVDKISFKDMYKLCKILITQRMVVALENPLNFEQRSLANLLFEMKSELRFVESVV